MARDFWASVSASYRYSCCVLATAVSVAFASVSATSVFADEVQKSNLGAQAVDAAARDVPAVTEAGSTGNPLWAVPLDALSMTRERPLFSPSRRPPPPVVVAL